VCYEIAGNHCSLCVRSEFCRHEVGACFFYFFVYLRIMARRRVRGDDEIVSVLDISNESRSDINSSDCEISDADASESESSTSDWQCNRCDRGK
jgi:hypothetical protein